MRGLVLKHLRWEPRGLGAYETVRARLMHRVIPTIMVPLGATVIGALIAGPVVLALLPAGFLLIYALALKLLLAGRQQSAAGLIILSGVVTLYALMLSLGGLRGPLPVQLGVIAALAVTWLDPRSAWALVFLTALLPAVTPLASQAWPVTQLLGPAEARTIQLCSKLYAVTVTGILVGMTIDALNRAGAEAQAREAEARTAEAAAKEATERKAVFLATMSHELRTPINAIIGYSELLREEGGPAEPDLERIGTTGKALLLMVDDLLEMARNEAAPRARLDEPIDLVELVEEAVARLVELVDRVPNAEVHASADLPPAIGDRSDLRRIVRSLLGTACRSTREGRIHVSLWADDLLHLAVRDHQLEPGVRDAPIQRDLDGSGLGLALARQLAGALGGRIEAVDEARGATVTLHLPMRPS